MTRRVPDERTSAMRSIRRATMLRFASLAPGPHLVPPGETLRSRICRRARPSGRCIKTLSSQRPNLKPTLSKVPTMRKPAARWSSIEPALAESPITAIICRNPRRLRLRDQPLDQRAADATAMRPRRDVDRILDAPVIGRAGAIGPGIGVAREFAIDFRHQIGIAAARAASRTGASFPPRPAARARTTPCRGARRGHRSR